MKEEGAGRGKHSRERRVGGRGEWRGGGCGKEGIVGGVSPLFRVAL